MEPEYRKLIKGEKVQSFERTVLDQREGISGNHRKLNATYKRFEELTREKDSYKSAYEDEQAKHGSTRKFVKVICYLGKDTLGDKNYRWIINKIGGNINPKYRKTFRNMIALGREVMVMFKQKDERSGKHIAFKNNAIIRTKQEEDKGFDLEL